MANRASFQLYLILTLKWQKHPRKVKVKLNQFVHFNFYFTFPMLITVKTPPRKVKFAALVTSTW
jgi:hypothetical protein